MIRCFVLVKATVAVIRVMAKLFIYTVPYFSSSSNVLKTFLMSHPTLELMAREKSHCKLSNTLWLVWLIRVTLLLATGERTA